MGWERREGRERKTKRERKRKERDFRERSSTFSLEFLAIGPSVPVRQEEKLLPTTRATRGYRFCGVLKNSKR